MKSAPTTADPAREGIELGKVSVRRYLKGEDSTLHYNNMLFSVVVARSQAGCYSVLDTYLSLCYVTFTLGEIR